MADDIKINLGLDANGLFAGLQKATVEVQKLNSVKIDLNETPAIADLNKIEAEAKQTGEAIDKNLGGGVEGLKGKLGGLTGGLGDLGGSFQSLTGGVSSLVPGLGSLSGILAGGGITAGIAALGGGIAYAIDKGKEFETQLASLSSITGVSGSGLQDLGDKAQVMAGKFGTDASANIEAFKTILSKLGPDIAKSPEALNSMAESVNTLSKATGDDPGKATEALTGALLQFGVSLDDPKNAAEAMAVAMNVLAAGAKEGASEVPDVAAAINVAGVAASSAKVSFEETNSAIQILAAGGKVGAEAGTSLRNVLNKLGEGRFLPKDTAAELKAAGVDINKLGDTSITFSERLRELNKISGDAALKTKLFGTDAAAAAILIKGASTSMDGLTEKLTGTQTATEQAAINMATFDEQLNRIKSNVDNFAIAFYQGMQMSFGMLAESTGPAIGELMTNIGGYFTRLWSVVQPILALIGGAIMVTIVDIINVAVGVVNVFYENAIYAFDSIVNALQPLINAIKSALGIDGAIGEGIDATKILQDVMNTLGDVIGGIFDIIAKLGKIIIDVFVNGISIAINTIVAVSTAIVDFGKYIGNLILQIPGVTTVINGLKSAFETVYNFFANLPAVINDVQIYLKAIGFTFQSIFGILKESFDAALKLDFSGAANKLASVFESSTWVNAFSSNLQKARTELKTTTEQATTAKKTFDEFIGKSGEPAKAPTPKVQSGAGKTIAKEVKEETEKELKEKPINVKVVLGGENDKELQSQLKTALSGLEKESGTIQTSLEKLVPDIGAKTQEELDSTIAQYESYVLFIKQQSLEIEEARNIAIGLGDEKAQQQLDNIISYNNQALEATKTSLNKYKEESAKTIGNNTLEYQIATALQTSLLDTFNADKLRKEKETNDAIRKERLDSLDAEENDLNKSLAKREISAEEYAAKLADINKGRQKAQEETEVTVLERLKQAGDKVVGDVLKTQGAAFTEQAKKMEGGSKIMYEAMGGLATSFGALAASGKATLKDFAGASIDIAVQAMMKMIPIWTAEIFATSVAELGIGGLAVAAGLQIVLMGLVSAARSAGGFKDGVVGLHGEGTETSDSIPAWLSKGESVITARATRNNREELEFMNRTGLSIAEFYKMRMPSTSVSITPEGDLIREVRKLREETRGLGVRIQRNTSVEVSGVLTADSKSINALIVEQKRRSARRG